LLPHAACQAVGRVHEEGAPAYAMLMREGFRYQNLVDIFDAGPTVAAPRDEILTVREAQRLSVEIGEPEGDAPVLVSTPAISGFRAVRTSGAVRDGNVVLQAAAAEALKVSAGEMVRVKV
jgi:arginine N-succinyltransferase